MIRDFLTVSIVSLTLFGSVPDHDCDSLGLQLMAATGDVRRTLSRFLDLYAGIKAGAQQTGGKLGDASKKGGGKDGKSGEAKPAPYRPSYLLGIQQVRDLYRRGKYEVAMVRLKKLEEAYPGDVKLLTMKGTLWVKIGRDALARKAWERVLQIDQDNQKVIEALERLNQSE